MDLSDDILLNIFKFLKVADIVSCQNVRHPRFNSLLETLNEHICTQFQVAVNRMQVNLDMYENWKWQRILWPQHVMDLMVFYPIFEDKSKFISDFLHFYCPMARILRVVPETSCTLYGSCYMVTAQLFELTQRRLTITNIKQFVDTGYAALESLKTLTISESAQQPVRLKNILKQIKRLSLKEYPDIMDYVNELDQMSDSELIVRQWNGTTLTYVPGYIQQAVTRIRIFENVMQNIESLSLNCMSVHCIVSGVLYHFPNLVKLQLKLYTPLDLHFLIVHLAALNQVSDLHIDGIDVERVVLSLGMLKAFEKYTSLRRLTFKRCRFLTDRILLLLVQYTVNVNVLGSQYNENLTAHGVYQCMDMQRQIRTLEINEFIVHRELCAWIYAKLHVCCSWRIISFVMANICLVLGIAWIIYYVFRVSYAYYLHHTQSNLDSNYMSDLGTT